MPQLKLLAEGKGEYLKVDPDGYRRDGSDPTQRATAPQTRAGDEGGDPMER